MNPPPPPPSKNIDKAGTMIDRWIDRWIFEKKDR